MILLTFRCQVFRAPFRSKISTLNELIFIRSKVWCHCRGARTGLVAAAVVFCIASGVAAAPARVVSINLCSDQYLLALASPGQIASVTWLAADAVRSSEAKVAAGIPVNRGRAEEVVAFRPDMVFANQFSDPAAISLIRRLDIPVVVLPAADDFGGVVENVRIAADALGVPERGRAVIAAIRETLGAKPTDGNRPVVAALKPGGYTEGPGTLMDEAIARAGGVSLGRRLGLDGYATLPLERLVAAPVDLLIESREATQYPSLGRAFLHHPALEARLAETPRLTIPNNLTDCPAPASAELVPLIRDALRRLKVE